jgi:hypothetical protein
MEMMEKAKRPAPDVGQTKAPNAAGTLGAVWVEVDFTRFGGQEAKPRSVVHTPLG